MNSDDLNLLRQLLGATRVLSLGVLVDGLPHVGLLPFATGRDGEALLVHASGLARHTRGLTDGARFSALVHAPDDPSSDPLQVLRVTLNGSVHPLATGTPEEAAARERYQARFPESAQTFELADFTLFALRVHDGRLVAGFARARNVSQAEFAEAAR